MTTETPRRAALYCRISEKKRVKAGEEVAHDSVAVQRKNLEKLARAHGYAVQEVYVDDGVSAYSGVTRKGWLKLLADMKLRKFDVILAVSEDRLARSTFEKTGLQRDCIDAGVTWHTVSSGMVDPETAEGGLLSTITGAIAQYESSIKRERLKARYDDEIEQGNALWGTRPFGYVSARDGVVIPEERELILGAYQTILGRAHPGDEPKANSPKADNTLYSIAMRWNVAGVKTTRGNEWTYQSVRQVLLRPRNAGLVVRGGVVQEGIKGNWEPLVSPETLSDAQHVLTSPERTTAPGRKQAYLCSGLIKCGVCDGPMRSHTVKVRGMVIPHYRCASKLRVSTDKTRHTAVRVDQIDPIVRRHVVSAFLMSTEKLFSPGNEIDTAPLRKEQAEIGAIVDQLVDALIENPRWTARIDKRLKALAKRDEELSEELRVAAESVAHSAMAVDLTDGLFANKKPSMDTAAAARVQLGEKFDSLPLMQKRDLVKSLLDVTINPGRKLQRIEVKHLVAVGLNDSDEPEDAL